MKKGYQCQKDNLIKNIPYLFYKDYPNNKVLISETIKSIIDNIELNEQSSQILFSKSLTELSKKIISDSLTNNNTADLPQVLVIILHFITAISTLEKTVSDEYILCLTNLVNFCHEKKFKIVLTSDILDYAVSLGKFGQSTDSRKFSVYCCTCLVGISKKEENDLKQRLLLLFDDPERIIRLESAFQMRYLFKEWDSDYCVKNCIQFLNSYLNDELLLCATAIESILYESNILKFDREQKFIQGLLSKIEEIIDTDDYCVLSNDFNYLSQIFVNMVNCSYENKANTKRFASLIVKFLNNYYFVNEVKNSTNVAINLSYEYGLDHAAKIINILVNQPDKAVLNDFIFCTFNRFFESLEKTTKLYSKMPLLIQNIPLEIFTKKFFEKVFFFVLEEEPFQFSFLFGQQTSYKDLQTVKFSDFKESWLSNFSEVLQLMIKKNNDTFIQIILDNLPRLTTLISKSANWETRIEILKSISLLPEYILFNHEKFPKFEENLDFILGICKDYLKVRNSYQFEKEVIFLTITLIQYSKNRDEIISFITEHLSKNTSYFYRRLYCCFFKLVIETFSWKFIEEKNIYQNFLEFFRNEPTKLILDQTIDLLIQKNFFNQELFTIVKQIKELKPRVLDAELYLAMKKYMEIFEEKGSQPFPYQKEEPLRKAREEKVITLEAIILENSKKEEVVIKKSKTKYKPNYSSAIGKGNKIQRKISLNSASSISEQNFPHVSHHDHSKNKKSTGNGQHGNQINKTLTTPKFNNLHSMHGGSSKGFKK